MLKSKIENSVKYKYDKKFEAFKHEFDKKLEDYKIQNVQRQKAEMFLTSEDQVEYFEELNKMSLQVSYWIEDVELLNEIMDRLSNATDKDLRVINAEVRKYILNNPDDKFESNKIVLWHPKDKEKQLFK